MVAAAFAAQEPIHENVADILNDVSQIRPQDYYAPIIGEFELLVLLALVRLGNGAYGAAILKEIRDRTGRDPSEGTVYMTLGRLEEKKMIASYVGVPTQLRGGRRRRHYLIDKDGERALARAWRAVHLMSEGIETEIAQL
jgi:PadR family transcriptional regulator